MPMVFSAANAHAPDCGEPPAIAKDDQNYYGYFENEHGEQWVFVFDHAEDRGRLRGGDIGWDTVVGMDGEGRLSGHITLGENERQWLAVCYKAATALRRRRR